MMTLSSLRRRQKDLLSSRSETPHLAPLQKKETFVLNFFFFFANFKYRGG